MKKQPIVKKKTPRKREHKMTGQEFEALSEAQKQKFIAEIESKTPEQRLAESRPMNLRERSDFEKRRKVGRPRFGKHGVKVIALSLEKDLLKRADQFAAKQGLKRSELFTQALHGILPKAG